MQHAVAVSAAYSEEPTTLSQYMYTHQRLTDLCRGPLPCDIVDQMTQTACGIAERILEAPAADWRELSKKAVLLIDELPYEEEWLDRIYESLRDDVARLSLAERVA
jgi:hypothetical protein